MNVPPALLTAVTSDARIGFLGPHGTFTEEALLTQPDLAAAQLVPLRSIEDVLLATQSGEVDYGFAAIENLIEGSVNITLDTLAFDTELLIQREVVLNIAMSLLVKPGCSLGNIRSVVSFPHALAQCRKFLSEHLPNVETVAATSTAEAARLLATNEDPHLAAIAPALAGKIYGLDALAENIEDHRENQTRFVLVAPHGIPSPTGHDKSSIVIFQDTDRPGSLLAILQEFAARDINLSKLESRPTKQTFGDYCFLLDLEGHIDDEVVADCLRSIHAKYGAIKFLGSYPAAGANGKETRAEVSARRQAAQEWFDSLGRRRAE